jgi:TonB family protein
MRMPEPPRSAEPVSASGPDRFGQYEILERIASGGMAELYKARRSGVEGFEKIVAIKKILPHLADNEEFIGMFADEAKLAAQLNHPNIVHIYDLGKIDGGGYFIAMEHVDGRDLRAILESARELGTPLPVPLAVYIASKVASALDYAHRRKHADGRELNVVHRDVSPQNILISYEGDIKLCDFGIAKAASKASQTQSGALKGKVPYMSPEQAWGKPIDRRSDLFSLGVVLYEMLTEQKLFRGDTDLTVLESVRAAVVTAPSAANPEVPRPLDAIVLKALARDAGERYANASDMLRDLESVLYSYSPAPGSADVAIYLHRLQAEEAAAAEVREREAVRAASEEPRPRRSKGAPIARRAESTPKLTVPERVAATPAPTPAAPPQAAKPVTGSGVFAAFPAKGAPAERKSRTVLYAGIAAAVLALGVTTWFLTRGRSAPAVPAPQPTAFPATPGPLPGVAGPAVTAAPAYDPKAVEEEVARQLAVRKKELQKQLEAESRRTARPLARTVPAAAAAAAEPTEAPSIPTEAPVARVEPSPLPTEPPPPTAAPRPTSPPAAVEAPVVRGELVGPGPGVVEPALAAPPAVSYPAIARGQRVSGKVVVLVLVDENGKAAEARLQQGISTRTGVNEAVVDAVRRAKFRPATKRGVPVKMWRTVVIDVKP